MERRDFLKTTIGAGLAIAGLSGCSSGGYNSKGLPTVEFGSTGIMIPRIVMGLGSRFCHVVDDSEANEILNFALDNGLFYWDTAHTYDNTIALPAGRPRPTRLVNSEERVGEVMKTRRREVFLSTKIQAREPSEAMKQLELSLKRLNTDKLDMLKIHSVDSVDDVNRMSQKGGLIDILIRMKEEKVTRFIGFSCHANAAAAKEITNRAPFDSMLIALNHNSPGEPFQETALFEAKKKNMGFLLMKAVRPRETVADIPVTDLIRYALSLDGPDALALGMDSIDVVKSNLAMIRNFQKLSPDRMKELYVKLVPFYRNENLPWMQKNYRDGNWNC